jgi:spermidine synthase
VISVNSAVIHKGARLLLACAFLSGATLLALEVVWFRFLTLYVLSTTLAASLMLAAVLASIGLGGLFASRWLPRQPAVGALVPALALLAGCSLVVSYAGFQSLTSGTQVGDWPRVLWFACALTCPTSLLSGASFTLMGDALRTEIAPDTRAAAWLTTANTTGALCGPPLAAFLFLPVLGMERTFFVLAVVYGVIGLLAFMAQPAVMPEDLAALKGPRYEMPDDLAALKGPRYETPEDLAALKGPRYKMYSTRWPAAGAASALIVALAVFPFGAMSGRYFVRAAQPYSGDGSQIVATREGGFETILLMQQRWMGQPVYNRLVTNGFSMSGTAVPGMRYMRYFAYWPMLLHNGPLRHALLVCYGVGVTAGAVLDIPSLESLDVAEISPDIVAMSDAIYAPDRHPLHDPRVRLHIEDGRYFLETTSTKYDLITGEPPPPRTPGAVNIYTREYFQLIHDHLAEGGMTTYWLPVGRPNPGTDVDTIVRAFCDVFEDCSLWNATPFDLMLVGSRHATGPVADVDVRTAWQTPALQARLREVGFEQPEQIGATFVGDAAFARELVADTPPLTDDFPHRLVPSPNRPSLSDPRYGIDRAVAERYQHTIDPTRGREAFRSSTFISHLWPARLVEQSLPFFVWQRVINRVFWEGGKPLAQIEDLHAVLTETSLRTLPLWLLGSDEVKQRIAETSDDGAGGLEYARGLRALTGRDYLGAAAAFLGAEQRGLRGPLVRPLRVYALCLGGHIDAARQLAQGIDPHDPDEQHFWQWLRATFEIGA